MFESGIVDVFVMLGPGPKDVSRQYGRLTGQSHVAVSPLLLKGEQTMK